MIERGNQITYSELLGFVINKIKSSCINVDVDVDKNTSEYL